MNDLKPCPFCGYKGVEILADDNEYLYYRYFSQCQRCGAGAKRGHTKEVHKLQDTYRVSV